jgi:integrase
MRDHGEGSITVFRGKYRVRAGDAARTPLGSYDTYAEAEGVLLGARRRAAELADTSGLSFASWATQVLASREKEGIRGIRQEKQRYRTHLEKAPFADMRLTDIDTPMVVTFIRRLAQKQAADEREARRLSRQTVIRVLALLSAIFAEAVLAGKRQTNPCSGVRVKQDGRSTEETSTALMLPEIAAIESCDEIPEWARCLMLFAIYTGMRQGEQWHMHIRDVHLEAASPHVVVRYGSLRLAPKNGRIRTVYLTGDAVRVLTRWLQILPSYAPSNPNGILFPTPTGLYRRPGSPEKSLKEGKRCTKVELLPLWLAAAGIKRPVRWHDFRHTCGTHLTCGTWGHEWSPQAVMEHLGHSSLSMTAHYTKIQQAGMAAKAAASTGHTLVTLS